MKKFLAFVLVIIISASVFCAASFSVSAADSGFIGDCEWRIENNELIISGLGSMGYNAQWPWWNKNFTKITIEEGVTNVGFLAFKDCEKVTTVSLPNSLSLIESGAFQNCSGLQQIIWHEGIQGIEDFAFTGCTSLKKVILPNSVYLIGSSAFYNCVSLETIEIGRNAIFYGNTGFESCTSLKSIIVHPGNLYYESVDGVLYTKGRAALMNYPVNKDGQSFTVPSGVIYITQSAFSGAKKLQSIVLPDSVVDIGSNAFEGTGFIENTNNYENGVLYAGKHAIAALKTATEVTIKEGTISIAPYTFAGCTSLKKVKIPNGIEQIAYSTFADCSNLETVYIPKSVTYIGDGAFSGCSRINQILYNGDYNDRQNIYIESSNHLITGPIWSLNACLDSPNHSYGEDVLVREADCVLSGLYEKTCSLCGYVSQRSTSAHGHTYSDWTVTIEPDCDTHGERCRKCLKCGITIYDRMDVLGHEVEKADVVTEPNCTNEGRGTGTCNRCGKSVEITISASGHNMGDWETTVAPTCTTGGKKERKCSVCGETETENVAPLGHDFKNPTVVKEATISSTGLMKGECKRCNAAAEEVIPCSWRDANTGIIFQSEEGVFAQNTILEVEKLGESDPDYMAAKNILSEMSNGITVYKITPILNGEETTINGNVNISFPLPENYGSDSKVFYVGLDGTAKQAPALVDGESGTIMARLDALGVCVICNGFNMDGVNNIINGLPDFSNILIYGLIGVSVLFLAIIVVVVILIVKRKKKE